MTLAWLVVILALDKDHSASHVPGFVRQTFGVDVVDCCPDFLIVGADFAVFAVVACVKK